MSKVVAFKPKVIESPEVNLEHEYPRWFDQFIDIIEFDTLESYLGEINDNSEAVESFRKALYPLLNKFVKDLHNKE